MSSRAQALSESERPPRLPERYRPRRYIASGGMASVWCAEDLVLDRNVAIKILAERFAHDQVAARRFKREARAAARVANHPHMVSVYDVGDLESAEGEAGDGQRPFLVMEYLAGGTVADAIRVGAVRRQEALRWISEAAAALDHAHACGIVHRDIKPANFLLDRSRTLHVTDFGIARLVSEDTITSDQLFGTAAYLSPEQALGQEATSASDRYALAVTAFELLAGERPFTAPHFAAQARQHIEDPPPAASARDRSLPTEVDEVLARAMAKDADARFDTAGAFVDALRHALTASRPAARALPGRDRRPVTPVTRPAAPVARERAGGAGGAGGERRVHGHGRRVIAVTALIVAVLGIAVVGLATLTGGSHHVSSATANGSRHAQVTAGPEARHRTAVARSGSATSSTQSAATPTPQQLQATGHQEMLDGDYQSAIPTLRQAVSVAPPNSTTYDYALFDLGRSLLLGGDPASAVKVLQLRLQIPNQTAVVQKVLDKAEQAAGQVPESATESTTTTTSSSTTTTSTTTSASPATPTPPTGADGPGKSDGHGRGFPHGGPTGGAGLAPGGHDGDGGHGPAVHGNLVD